MRTFVFFYLAKKKKAVRLMTFFIKFSNLVTFVIATYKFHNQLLPSVFQSFFTKLNTVHSYNTRHSAKQSYYVPKARTNYGKFDFRVLKYGIISIDHDIKHLLINSSFKVKLKQSFSKFSFFHSKIISLFLICNALPLFI